MNGYVCFWKTKRCEVYANSSYEAQCKAQIILQCKKRHEITVALAEVNSVPIVHTATD